VEGNAVDLGSICVYIYIYIYTHTYIHTYKGNLTTVKLFHSITLTKVHSVLKLEILGMLGGIIQECIPPNLGISIILYGKMVLILE
jgi:hypothetical protein